MSAFKPAAEDFPYPSPLTVQLAGQKMSILGPGELFALASMTLSEAKNGATKQAESHSDLWRGPAYPKILVECLDSVAALGSLGQDMTQFEKVGCSPNSGNEQAAESARQQPRSEKKKQTAPEGGPDDLEMLEEPECDGTPGSFESSGSTGDSLAEGSEEAERAARFWVCSSPLLRLLLKRKAVRPRQSPWWPLGPGEALQELVAAALSVAAPIGVFSSTPARAEEAARALEFYYPQVEAVPIWPEAGKQFSADRPNLKLVLVDGAFIPPDLSRTFRSADLVAALGTYDKLIARFDNKLVFGTEGFRISSALSGLRIAALEFFRPRGARRKRPGVSAEGEPSRGRYPSAPPKQSDADIGRRMAADSPNSPREPFDGLHPVVQEIREEEGEPVTVPPHIWRARISRQLLIVDACSILASDVVAYIGRGLLGRFGVLQPFKNELVVAVSLVPWWLAAIYLAGAYRAEIVGAPSEMFRRFYYGLAVGVLSLGFTSFALNLQLSRVYVASVTVLVFAVGTAGRIVALRRTPSRLGRPGGRWGAIEQRVLIIGTSQEAISLRRSLESAPVPKYRVIGFLDASAQVGSVVDGTLNVIGKPDDLPGIAISHKAGLVVVSGPAIEPGLLSKLQTALEGTDIDLAVSPSLFDIVLRRVRIEPVAYTPLIHLEQIRLSGYQAFVKRTFDIATSLALAVFSLPLMLAIGAAILLTDGAPVVYRQVRVGKDGRRFVMYKFRTMHRQADSEKQKLEELNEASGYFFKIRHDPRVTRVGRFLRRWSLDELPQVVNVLKGDMSMVGPRPPVPEEVSKYDAWHLRRLRVRPGITGLWQVSGRSDLSFEEAVRLDLFYIQNWSIWTDFWILARTVKAVLSRKGAY
jgi:exopolysaccharide biosynthesis polyprenyl glycosylphosphotransferase